MLVSRSRGRIRSGVDHLLIVFGGIGIGNVEGEPLRRGGRVIRRGEVGQDERILLCQVGVVPAGDQPLERPALVKEVPRDTGEEADPSGLAPERRVPEGVERQPVVKQPRFVAHELLGKHTTSVFLSRRHVCVKYVLPSAVL